MFLGTWHQLVNPSMVVPLVNLKILSLVQLLFSCSLSESLNLLYQPLFIKISVLSTASLALQLLTVDRIFVKKAHILDEGITDEAITARFGLVLISRGRRIFQVAIESKATRADQPLDI